VDLQLARVVTAAVGVAVMVVYVAAAAVGQLSIRKSITVFGPCLTGIFLAFGCLVAIDFLDPAPHQGVPFFVYYMAGFLVLEVVVVLPLLLRAKRRMAQSGSSV
jgi:hypothetical protein